MKVKISSFNRREIIERPQDMFMRVALGIHFSKPNKWNTIFDRRSDYEIRENEYIDDHAIAKVMKEKRQTFVPDLEAVLETYEYMSKGYFIHATPTLIYAGTCKPSLSSCFLIAIDDDSINGIYKTLWDCAKISKNAGGIGIHIHKIRANQSYIRGTAGESNGIVPMIQVYNNTARYVDQCFLPGTIVHTSIGPRNIEEIQKGDLLLTADGHIQPVEKVLEHQYNGDIFSVSIKCAIESVQLTPEHQVLALQKQEKGLNFSGILNRLDRGYAKPEMVDANDLCVDDFVCFPIPKNDDVVDITYLDYDDLRFYGILIGNGWIDKGDTGSISIILTDKKSCTHEFVENYLKCVGINPIITMHHDSDNIRYQWSTTDSKFKFRREHLYDDNNEKIIYQDFFRLPVDKQLSIIQGILEADGNIVNNFILQMPSKRVIDGVRYILMRCGILSSGCVLDRRGNVSSHREGITRHKMTYTLRIPRVPLILSLFPSSSKEKNVDYLVHNGMMYCRVTEIKKKHYTGKVYDFEIANEHTYVTDMGAVHNGGGKRKGAFAVYLEIWHADIEDFLKLKLPHGDENKRARDLFYCAWRNDYFMECVLEDRDWYLMCPDECPGLSYVYGDEFVELYEKYVSQGRYRKVVKARDIYTLCLRSRGESGVPYIGEKDSINRKSNQINLGIIQSSNLCTEIVLYSDPCETAVCNLASIALPKFLVKQKDDSYIVDHKSLHHVTGIVTRNLNKVIDRNLYPTKESERSNYRHRPIGIGVQGLADLFMLMGVPYDSEEAVRIDKEIFETIYHGALTASHQLALEEGPYSTFRFGKGSPLSHGKFQFDMWADYEHSGRWDWDSLEKRLCVME